MGPPLARPSETGGQPQGASRISRCKPWGPRSSVRNGPPARHPPTCRMSSPVVGARILMATGCTPLRSALYTWQGGEGGGGGMEEGGGGGMERRGGGWRTEGRVLTATVCPLIVQHFTALLYTCGQVEGSVRAGKSLAGAARMPRHRLCAGTSSVGAPPAPFRLPCRSLRCPAATLSRRAALLSRFLLNGEKVVEGWVDAWTCGRGGVGMGVLVAGKRGRPAATRMNRTTVVHVSPTA